MAQVDRATRADVDHLLKWAIAAWEELAEVEREIDSWDLIQQIVYIEEWPLEEERLRRLAEHARAGDLTETQLPALSGAAAARRGAPADHRAPACGVDPRSRQTSTYTARDVDLLLSASFGRPLTNQHRFLDWLCSAALSGVEPTWLFAECAAHNDRYDGSQPPCVYGQSSTERRGSVLVSAVSYVPTDALLLRTSGMPIAGCANRWRCGCRCIVAAIPSGPGCSQDPTCVVSRISRAASPCVTHRVQSAARELPALVFRCMATVSSTTARSP